MSSRYKFSEEEIAAIAEARRTNSEKQVERRLRALELRAKGMNSKDVAAICEYHPAYITTLVAKYRAGGLAAITESRYGGNRRNMSYNEEEELLAPFKEQAEKGELVEMSAVEAAYREAVGHSIGTGQIYYVLHRHGWRKVMPRSRHPKKASEEVIETSKKLRHS